MKDPNDHDKKQKECMHESTYYDEKGIKCRWCPKRLPRKRS